MKSNLKAIEAGGHGLAVLASNVLYEKTLVNGETAALFADVADLQQHLKMWVENPDAARQLGRRTRQWVAENHLAAHQVAQREQWYRTWPRGELNSTVRFGTEFRHCVQKVLINAIGLFIVGQ